MTIRRGNSIIAGCASSSGETSWDDIQGKPDFASVAESGSYNDLSGTPSNLSDFYNDLSTFYNDITFSNHVSFENGIDIDYIGTLNPNGITFSGDCEFTGNTTFSNDVSFTGSSEIPFNPPVRFDNDVTFNSNTNEFEGSARFNSGAEFNSDVTFNSDVDFSNTSNVYGIKTINGESIIGEGDIEIKGGGETSWDDVTGDNKPDITYDTSTSRNSSNSDFYSNSLYSDTLYSNTISSSDGSDLYIQPENTHFTDWVEFTDEVSFTGSSEIPFNPPVRFDDHVSFANGVTFHDYVDFSDATVTGFPGQTYYLKDGDTEIVVWKLSEGGYYCEQSGRSYSAHVDLPIAYSDHTYNIQVTPFASYTGDYYIVGTLGVDDSLDHIESYRFSVGTNGRDYDVTPTFFWKTSGYIYEDIEG